MADTQIIDAQIIEKELVGVDFAETEVANVQLNVIDILPYKKKLSTLDDVNISNIQDKDILTYDETTETFINEPLSETELAKIILNETPTKINSKRFQTANNFVTGKLAVYLNGMKINSSEIIIISSNTFEFTIDTIILDLIEVSYIGQ